MISQTAPPPQTPGLRAATLASYLVFAACGVLSASWPARIPQLRDHLHLQPSTLGWVLLAAAVGSFASRPLSAPIVARLGQRSTATAAAILACLGLIVVGVGDMTGLAVFLTGLLIIGLSGSTWDVVMNVQGVEVERSFGRSIMPRFHAAFAAGTVAGAAVAIAMVARQVPVAVHLTLIAVIVALAVPLAARHYLTEPRHQQTSDKAIASTPRSGGSALRAWGESRTLLIGLFVLTFAFAEGSANDWIGVALIDGHHAVAAVGTIGYAIFLAALTAARWFGASLLDRYGRVLTFRALGILTIVGLLLFILGPNTPIALAGLALWGAGTAFGYPVGMSAGADDPRYAASRVAVISTIGKLATFAGPPLIGFVGDRVTVLHALLVVAALQAVALLIAGATRPLPAAVKDA